MVIFHKNLEKIEDYSRALKTLSNNNTSEEEKEKLREIIKELKEYESFKGRINYSNFIELFNFENKVYQDKQFKYSLISNNNKRLIPEFISGACAKLIYDGLIDIEIRTKLEQYFIAILANLDYHNYATLDQLKDKFKEIAHIKCHYFVLGSCPLSFQDHQVDILKERIAVTNTLFTYLNINADMAKLYLQNNVIEKIKSFKGNNIEIVRIENNDVTSKLTKEEIKEILTRLKDNISDPEKPYNLVLFASTYHISKVAHEIEKYFYGDKPIHYPKNIFILGTEKFFDLITSKRVLNPNDDNEKQKSIDELFILKKMQSFLFEIFMHSLDRNRQK